MKLSAAPATGRRSGAMHRQLLDTSNYRLLRGFHEQDRRLRS